MPGVFYPITPSTEGGEIYQQSFARGAAQRLRPAARWPSRPRASTRRRAAPSPSRCAASASVNFTSGPGHRLRRGAVLPRARQVLDDGAGGGGARAHQARAQRALRPRRLLRRARHRLDHALRQGRAAGRRPGAHPAPGRRSCRLNPGHEHPGRLAHHAPRADVLRGTRRSCSASSWARPTTSSTARPPRSASCSAPSAAACRR